VLSCLEEVLGCPEEGPDNHLKTFRSTHKCA
jgi:hypothetical protein